jgi:hypothetical protein
MKACGEKHLKISMWIIGIMLTSLFGTFLLVDTKLARAVEPIRELEAKQSGISATLQSIDQRTARIETILTPKGYYNEKNVYNPMSPDTTVADCGLHGQSDAMAP